jgi:hypothetical protein
MTSEALPASSLLNAPRMTALDVDMPLCEEDYQIIEEFEDAWAGFLSNNPGQLPKGKRGMRTEEIEKQLKDLTNHKNNVESELARQLQFFGSSKERMEDNFKLSARNATGYQQKVSYDLQKQLDQVAMADIQLSQALPWEHFFENLDGCMAAELALSPASESVATHGSKTLKPSQRSMFLVDDTVGDVKDIQLRACRIDHALLGAQVKALQKEVDRHEKTTESLERVGKFLTENNVWGILTKSSP